MKPTHRTFKEIREQAQKEFFEANGYYPTVEEAVRLTEEARAEIEKERSGVSVHKETANDDSAMETICGVKFYYSGFKLTNEIVDYLTAFAKSADDEAYSVYMDSGKLVVY